MGELMGDDELARLRATLGERGSLFPPRQVAALLARLDAERARADAEASRRIACAARVRDANAAEAGRDALRAALRELRDAAEGLDGLPGGSGGRYARALREAARLLGEGGDG